MTTQERVKLPDYIKCKMCGSQMYAEGINLVCENNHHFNPQTHFYKHVVLDVLGFKKLAEEVYYSSRARRNLNRRVIASEVVKYLFKDGIFTYDQLPTCEICGKRKCSFNGSISPHTRHPKYQYVSSVCPNRQCVSKKTASTDANAMRRPEGVQRYREKLKEKYGVDNPAKLPDVRRKIAEAHLKKNYEDVYEREVKSRKTFLSTKGQLGPNEGDEIKAVVEKCLRSGISIDELAQYEKTLYNWYKNNPYIEILSDFRTFVRSTFKHVNTFKCLRCGEIYTLHRAGAQVIDFYYVKTNQIEVLLKRAGCPKCDERNIKSTQEFELLKELVQGYKGEVINNYVIAETRSEFDLFIPEYNIALEYDHLFWHSSQYLHRVNRIENFPDFLYEIMRLFRRKIVKRYVIETYSIYCLRFLDRELHVPSLRESAKSKVLQKLGILDDFISINTHGVTFEQTEEQTYHEKYNFWGTSDYPGSVHYNMLYEGNIIGQFSIVKYRNNRIKISRFTLLPFMRAPGILDKTIAFIKRTYDAENGVFFSYAYRLHPTKPQKGTIMRTPVMRLVLLNDDLKEMIYNEEDKDIYTIVKKAFEDPSLTLTVHWGSWLVKF